MISPLNNFKENFKILIDFPSDLIKIYSNLTKIKSALIKEEVKKNYDQFTKFIESKNYFFNNFDDDLINKLNQYNDHFEKLRIYLANILRTSKNKQFEIQGQIKNKEKKDGFQPSESIKNKLNYLKKLIFDLEKSIGESGSLEILINRMKKFTNLIDSKIKDYKAKKDQKLIWETAQNLFNKIRQTKTELEEPLINDEFFKALIEEIKDQKCK